MAGDVQIFVGGVREATERLYTTKFDAAVSFADPDYVQRPINLGLVPRVLKLDFHDRTLIKAGKVLVTPEDAKTIVAFLRESLDAGCENFLFHCLMGRARSTAAALALLWLRYGDDRLADRLLEIRPMALPNVLVVILLEDALGLSDNRKLTAAVKMIEDRSTAPLQLLRMAQEDED